MIPYDIDPSLHPAEPLPPQLDDGFSPRTAVDAATLSGDPADTGLAEAVDPALWAKSAF